MRARKIHVLENLPRGLVDELGRDRIGRNVNQPRLQMDTGQTDDLRQFRPHERLTTRDVEEVDRAQRFEDLLDLLQAQVLLGQFRIGHVDAADVAGLAATLTGRGDREGQRQGIDRLDPAPACRFEEQRLGADARDVVGESHRTSSPGNGSCRGVLR